MGSRPKRRKLVRAALPVSIAASGILLVWLLGGCSVPTTPEAAPTAELPTVPASHPQETPTIHVPTLVPSPVVSSAPLTLTLWLPDTGSFTSPQRRGWQQAMEMVEQTNPSLRIQRELKKPHGAGGILDLLLTTHAVVPECLPDLVALDVTEVKRAAAAGVLQTLHDLLPASLLEDLYPVAVKAGTYSGQLLAVQFEVEFPILVYDASVFPSAPVSWRDIFTRGALYALPAGGGEAVFSSAVLPQYLGIGGRVVDSDGQIILNQQKLAQVFQFYRDGVQNGTIPIDVLQLTSLSDSWERFKSRDATIVHVSSSWYTRDHQGLPWAGFGFVPTANGPAPGAAAGWCWAITTSDPARREASAELIAVLMDTQVMAMEAQDNHHLPTRRSALALTTWSSQEYATFLRDMLAQAIPYPHIPGYASLSQTLQSALDEVILGEATPEEAADKVTRTLATP